MSRVRTDYSQHLIEFSNRIATAFLSPDRSAISEEWGAHSYKCRVEYLNRPHSDWHVLPIPERLSTQASWYRVPPELLEEGKDILSREDRLSEDHRKIFQHLHTIFLRCPQDLLRDALPKELLNTVDQTGWSRKEPEDFLIRKYPNLAKTYDQLIDIICHYTGKRLLNA